MAVIPVEHASKPLLSQCLHPGRLGGAETGQSGFNVLAADLPPGDLDGAVGHESPPKALDVAVRRVLAGLENHDSEWISHACIGMVGTSECNALLPPIEHLAKGTEAMDAAHTVAEKTKDVVQNVGEKIKDAGR